MKVLIACEFSGIIREAFRSIGHDAYSCDLEPSLDNSKYHIQGNVTKILNDDWDLMIAHPPCTYLAVSGNTHFISDKNRWKKQLMAVRFVLTLARSPIPAICIENPVSMLASLWRRSDQTIQPWQFGHGEVKRTCLWLKNLPKLKPTKIVEGREKKMYKISRSSDRSKLRSITYTGIAEAMANQWGNL